MQVKLDEFIKETISEINNGLRYGCELNHEIHLKFPSYLRIVKGGKFYIKVINMFITAKLHIIAKR